MKCCRGLSLRVASINLKVFSAISIVWRLEASALTEEDKMNYTVQQRSGSLQRVRYNWEV